MFFTVAKDTGGLGAVLPVHGALRKRGIESQLIASGVSRDVLNAHGIPFVEAVSPEEVLVRFGTPDLLVTSMCTGGGIGRDLIPLLAGRSPTVVVQDQWGVLKEWADPRYCPDYVVVNDFVGRAHVNDVWPQLPNSNIQELGFAALDVVNDFDVARARAYIHGLFAIAPHVPVVSFFGQLTHTALAATEVVRALTAAYTSNLPVLLVGMHPRLTLERAEEAMAIRAALASYTGRVIYLPTNANKRIPIENVVAASEVVLTMSSTALTYAAAMRIPGIAVLYADSPMRDLLQAERAGTFTSLPLGVLGCVAVAEDYHELTVHLRNVRTRALAPRLREAQKKYLRTGGGTADRIADFLVSLTQAPP